MCRFLRSRASAARLPAQSVSQSAGAKSSPVFGWFVGLGVAVGTAVGTAVGAAVGVAVGSAVGVAKGNDGLIYTATWTDGTYSYAVMCNAGMSAEQLSVWVEALA